MKSRPWTCTVFPLDLRPAFPSLFTSSCHVPTSLQHAPRSSNATRTLVLVYLASNTLVSPFLKTGFAGDRILGWQSLFSILGASVNSSPWFWVRNQLLTFKLSWRPWTFVSCCFKGKLSFNSLLWCSGCRSPWIYAIWRSPWMCKLTCHQIWGIHVLSSWDFSALSEALLIFHSFYSLFLRLDLYVPSYRS